MNKLKEFLNEADRIRYNKHIEQVLNTYINRQITLCIPSPYCFTKLTGNRTHKADIIVTGTLNKAGDKYGTKGVNPFTLFLFELRHVKSTHITGGFLTVHLRKL